MDDTKLAKDIFSLIAKGNNEETHKFILLNRKKEPWL